MWGVSGKEGLPWHKHLGVSPSLEGKPEAQQATGPPDLILPWYSQERLKTCQREIRQTRTWLVSIIPAPGRLEAGEPYVQGHAWLYNELEAALNTYRESVSKAMAMMKTGWCSCSSRPLLTLVYDWGFVCLVFFWVVFVFETGSQRTSCVDQAVLKLTEIHFRLPPACLD